MVWLNLAKVLDKKGWSASQLARELGVGYTTVARYFGKNHDHKFSTIIKWAEVLECEVEDLIDHSLSSKKKTMPKPKTTQEAIKVQKKGKR